MTEVVPGRVWQGDRVAAFAEATGREWTGKTPLFRAVLCPAFNVRLAYDEELAVLILPVNDHDDVLPIVFDLAVSFHRTCGPTFVHCFGGRNRSVAFAAALAVAEGRTLDQAFETMREEPTPELRQALRRWVAQRGAR